MSSHPTAAILYSLKCPAWPAHITRIMPETLMETHSKKNILLKEKITASRRNVILQAVVQKSNTYYSSEHNPDTTQHAFVGN